jgi:hypothetical protein
MNTQGQLFCRDILPRSALSRIMWRALLTSIALCASAATMARAAEWTDLFDGKTLSGWSVHSGFAKYEAQDGMIVGTAVKGSPNSFLCTDKTYGDFILEFDVKVDEALNSGVQFRSEIAPEDKVLKVEDQGKSIDRKIPKDRVYGLQVEIAQSQDDSGNVYDEARRARFLDDFAKKPAARAAFKDKEWNRYLVVCKGNSVRTWINGVPCAEFNDSLTQRGTIGLQVHGLGNRDFQPYQVRWRNLRLLALE